MGSVMTEVLHGTAHHHSWETTAVMRDAPAHARQQSQSSPNDRNDRSIPRSRSTSSQSQPPSTYTPRSSHASTSTSRSSTQTPQPTAPSQPSGTRPESNPSQNGHHSQPPSPRLPPTGDARVAQTHGSPPVPRDSSADNANDGSSKSSPPIPISSLQEIRDRVSPEAGSRDYEDDEPPPRYDISQMKIEEVIEMVAGLLTKITATNDEHYDSLHKSIPGPSEAASLSQQTTCVLAFHGKNVPSITILQYLARINKYCPATFEVFLSLLVYFDRMTERVNSRQLETLRQAEQDAQRKYTTGSKQEMSEQGKPADTPPSSDTASPSADRQPHRTQQPPTIEEPPSPPLSDSDPTNLSSFFVVDSFNIHRLVIAGVTCAAKFFSDVFFTNSRYAKVGGLPLTELNLLELHFLNLNDFRLKIDVAELEHYATMLVEFYARESAPAADDESMEEIQTASR